MEEQPGICNELTKNSINELLVNEIDVIQIKNFYPSSLSKNFAEKVISHSKLDFYKKQNTVARLGMGYIDVEKSPEMSKKYHDEAVASIQLVRDLIYPHISPMDHLRLLLQEIWPSGANLETIDNQVCFVGTCRVFAPEVKLLPHNDRQERLLISGNADLLGQLAVNIYFQLPEKGGELELWLEEPSDEQDKIIAANDGIDKDKLEPPKLVLRPDVGDLVIINSHLIHNVTPGYGKERVSISSFIGYKGENKPLSYWS